MAEYRISVKADADIEAIAAASVQQWGLAVAEKYIAGLHATFGTLAAFPDIGRDAGDIRVGYHRLETASHSVFYRKTEYGVLIVRVLHQRMDVERYL